MIFDFGDFVTRPTFVVYCQDCHKIAGFSIAKDFSQKNIQFALSGLRETERVCKSVARRLHHDMLFPIVSTDEMCQCRAEPIIHLSK